jgi:proteasome alpha subunit
LYPVSQSGGYDRVATMFSPDGRLYQVEYASKILSQGTVGVALKYDKGILFGADKKLPSKLIHPNSVEKLFQIDTHVAAVSAGLVGDARRLIQVARERAQENVMMYEQPIPIEALVKDISNIKQAFTQYGGMRPFGISFIIGGVDRTGKRLFETEPSGALAEYHAVAIGKNRSRVMEFLEKNYTPTITLTEGINLLINALEKGLDEKEKMDYTRLDFAYIDEKKEFTHIPNEEIKKQLKKK